ncbi:hypothetical protein N0V85_006641 [Neurospora sp. IMI 360204]|nr:hypothetical protein N0V85_006641 [Neurospora sp. IMI 360204]
MAYNYGPPTKQDGVITQPKHEAPRTESNSDHETTIYTRLTELHYIWAWANFPSKAKIEAKKAAVKAQTAEAKAADELAFGPFTEIRDTLRLANLSGHPVRDPNAGALRGRLLPRATNVVLVAFDHDLSVDERLLVSRGLVGKAKIEAKKDAVKAQPAEAKAADEKASLLMRQEQKAEKLHKQLEKVESSIKRRENLPAPYDFLHVPYRVSQEKARAARRRRRGAPVGALIALNRLLLRGRSSLLGPRRRSLSAMTRSPDDAHNAIQRVRCREHSGKDGGGNGNGELCEKLGGEDKKPVFFVFHGGSGSSKEEVHSPSSGDNLATG